MASKIPIIREFVTGLMELRREVKADAKKLLSRIDLSVLADREALTDFLAEMVTALSEKHLVKNNRVQPQAARLIKSYVRGMVKS